MKRGYSAYPAESTRKGWLASLITVVLLVIAFFVGRATAPDDSPPTPSTADQASDGSGVPRNEASAVDAATDNARVMASFSGDRQAYLEEAVGIAAPQWESRAEELAQGAADFISERYGSGAVVEFKPIRYRVKSYSEDRAEIDIWGVVLATGSKIGGIEESWVTGTIELVWVKSEWKVAGQSSKGGPTPELLRTEDTATDSEIINEFREYEE
jgi:hypothetical protein